MGQIVLITSGKGGVGKSTVAAFAGAALCRRGQKTLLMEGTRRSLDLMLGAGDRVVYDLRDVMEGRCALGDALLPGKEPGTPDLLAAPVSGKFLPDARFFDVSLCEAGQYYDYVLVEADGQDARLLEAAAPRCTMAIIVASPDPVSARDGRVVSDKLAGLKKEPRLCINRLPRDFARLRPVPDLDYMIDTVCAQLIAVIPLDEKLPVIGGIGQVSYLSKTTQLIFDNLAQRIMGKELDLLVQ